MAKLITEANTYGQIELNQVAFRRDGRIIAQYKLNPAKTGDTFTMPYVENGMLLSVDHVTRTIKYPTTGQTTGLALNYTTEHMYDERLAHGLKHFKLDNGTFRPRLGILATGDRFTTNTVDIIGSGITYESIDTDLKKETPSAKYYGFASTTGYITVSKLDSTYTIDKAVLEVIETTTMPDGSPAIKFVAL